MVGYPGPLCRDQKQGQGKADRVEEGGMEDGWNGGLVLRPHGAGL